MPTLDQLNAVANAVPVLNQRAAKQAQAARSMQVVGQVANAAPNPGMSATRLSQAVAPQAVQDQAQIQAQSVAQTNNELSDIAQTGLGVQASNDEAAVAKRSMDAQTTAAAADNQAQADRTRAELAMRKRVTGAEQASAARLQKVGIDTDNKLQLATIRQRQQLDRLGGDVRAKILDSRLQFERDEIGRKFSNERQLADYTAANAKTEMEFNDHMREVQQTADRKIQLMEVAERKLRQALENSFTGEQTELNNQNRYAIAQMATHMREKIAREKARAAARMAMWQGGGAIVGAVIGAVFTAGTGTAAGAAVGAAVGGGVGTMVGASEEN